MALARWTPDLWHRNGAVRFLRGLREGAKTVPFGGAFALATTIPFSAMEYPSVQICRPWERIGNPHLRRATEGFRVLFFADGTCLALRACPNHKGLLLLPDMPFLGTETNVDADTLHALWRPALAPEKGDVAWWFQPATDADMVFPSPKDRSPTVLSQSLQPVQTMAARMACFFPNLPTSVQILGGCAHRPPHVAPMPGTHPETPEWYAVMTYLSGLVERALPGRSGLCQIWDADTPGHADPRRPQQIKVFLRTFGWTPTTAHEKLWVAQGLPTSIPA